MKKIMIIFITFLVVILSSIAIFGTHKNEVDYTIKTGNELSSKTFKNNFISKMSKKIEHYNITIPEKFRLVTENEYLSLYLEEETMAIAILYKENGYVWFSYDVERNYDQEVENKTISQEIVNQIKSGILIRTYTVFTPGLKTLLDKNLLGKNIASIQYDITSKGFIAHVDFTSIKIKFDVVVEIETKDLVIEVPYDTIDEYDPNLWEPGNKDVSLNDLLIYPFFGATEDEDNGYIVIPDGSGAIVSLQETPKYNLSYSAPVYGKDMGYSEAPEISSLKVLTVKPLSRVTLPIYGIIHDVGNTGMLVISESGANYATYNYVSKDVTTDYYQSYFQYNYRTSYKQFQSRSNKEQHILGFQPEPNHFELKQRYVFLSGDEANYVGIAKKYRKFLEINNGFHNQKINVDNFSTKIDIIGNEIERGIFSEKNVPTTTYSETVNLLKQLQNDGYKKLDVTYKTFSKGKSAYRFDVFNQLGGEKELDSLINYLNEHNINFDYYVDYVNSFHINKYSANRINRKVLSDLNYSYMYLYSYVNDAKYLKKFMTEDINDYKKYGIDSLAFYGLNSILYTHTDKNRNVKYSTENMDYVMDALSLLEKENMTASIYNPDAYLYKYTDKYYDAPLSSSELMFIEATIPLVELITSGHMELFSPYLNFISSEETTLLRLVEYGINPSYIMTSKNTYKLKYSNSSNVYVSQYETLSNRMSMYNEVIKKGLSEVSGIEMINHWFYEKGVSVSEFANGKKIVVNYNNEDINFEGKIIKAKGYDVL